MGKEYRGFDDSFWRPLDQIREILEREHLRIPSRVLKEGPCPGLARVYFSLTTEPELGDPDEVIVELLNERIDQPRRRAGRTLDRWVDLANEGVNRILSRDRADLDPEMGVPQELLQHYEERLAGALELAEGNSLAMDQLTMEIKPPLSPQTLPITESTPDGMWFGIRGVPGGVFETKLTPPPDPTDGVVLAGYSVTAEYVHKRPFDIGVMLSVDHQNREVVVRNLAITLPLRDVVRQNIERVVSLIAVSRIGEDWRADEPRWEAKLYRPQTPPWATVCDHCPYRGPCRGEEDPN